MVIKRNPFLPSFLQKLPHKPNRTISHKAKYDTGPFLPAYDTPTVTAFRMPVGRRNPLLSQLPHTSIELTSISFRPFINDIFSLANKGNTVY